MVEEFIDHDSLETVVFEWGQSKWMSTPDITGAESFSVGQVQLEPGKAHERHAHQDSEEVLYFLSGEGIQMIDDKEKTVSAGDVVYIPDGVEHSTENTSWEPLRFLAMYGPPGPESEIQDMPDNTVLPPGELPD
ncbi:cupin domain-containing protein [Haladaptatus sp. DYF46]|uniref:cupin domain-containing protein n=1 Tax=Haladaptatus sp. DYF46 TaxID=2886041 RepID=UPI001E40F8FA|nr:cupin domain-containing protein [Haladaptatus sp. DYF46]